MQKRERNGTGFGGEEVLVQKMVQNCTGFGGEEVLVQKKILFYTEEGLLGENGAENGAEWHRIRWRRSFGAKKGAELHRSGAGKVPERRGEEDLPGGKRKF